MNWARACFCGNLGQLFEYLHHAIRLACLRLEADHSLKGVCIGDEGVTGPQMSFRGVEAKPSQRR